MVHSEQRSRRGLIVVGAVGLLALAIGARVEAACTSGDFELRHVGSTTVQIATAWAPQAGATSYGLQRSLTPDFASAVTYTLSSAINAYGDTGRLPADRSKFFAPSVLSSGATYYYRVVAHFSGSADRFSDCVSAQLASGPQRGTAGDLWADVVLGQPDFGQNAWAKTTASVLQWPSGAVFDTRPSTQPTRLYVADSDSNRILGFDHLGQCGAGTQLNLAAGKPYTSSAVPHPSYPDSGGEFPSQLATPPTALPSASSTPYRSVSGRPSPKRSWLSTRRAPSTYPTCSTTAC